MSDKLTAVLVAVVVTLLLIAASAAKADDNQYLVVWEGNGPKEIAKEEVNGYCQEWLGRMLARKDRGGFPGYEFSCSTKEEILEDWK